MDYSRPALLAYDNGDLVIKETDDAQSNNKILPYYACLDQKGIMDRLPSDFQDRLSAMSPINCLKDIKSPLILLLHDIRDTVIPVGESRRLMSMLLSRVGIHYTELQFQHLNPAKLPVFRLVRELVKFYIALCPLFYD